MAEKNEDNSTAFVKESALQIFVVLIFFFFGGFCPICIIVCVDF